MAASKIAGKERLMQLQEQALAGRNERANAAGSAAASVQLAIDG